MTVDKFRANVTLMRAMSYRDRKNKTNKKLVKERHLVYKKTDRLKKAYIQRTGRIT